MARIGFQTVSLTSGTYTAELYAGGRTALRGAGGKFVSPTAVGVPDLKAMFMQVANEAAAVAKRKTPKYESKGRVQFVGFSEVVYVTNYLEAVLNAIPKVKAPLQNALQMYTAAALNTFVREVVQPKAMAIINEIVYVPAMQRLSSRMSLMQTRRTKGRKHADTDAFVWLGSYDKKTGERVYGKRERWMEARLSEGPGSDAATWGERRYEQRTARLQKRMDRITKVGEENTYNAPGIGLLGTALTTRQRVFGPGSYAGPTGTLRRALLSGISVRGATIVIGIDESLFPPRKYGTIYWHFVEHGHKYKMPSGKFLPYDEPKKPFLATLNAWMASEGKQLLEAHFRKTVDEFGMEASSLLARIMSARAMGMSGITDVKKYGSGASTNIKDYFNKPGREFTLNINRPADQIDVIDPALLKGQVWSDDSMLRDLMGNADDHLRHFLDE